MGLVAKAFQDIITFSRASSGTYVNSNGYITNSSVLNYLTYSNQPENAAWTKSNSFVQTNLLTYSQEFDNAAWSKTSTSATANATIAPDGTLTADVISETATTAVHIIANSATVSASAYTLSVYLKKGVGSTAPDWVQLYTGGVSAIYANFNLSTGAVGNSDATSATMTPDENGWYRCQVVFTPTAGVLTTALAFTNNTNPTARATSSYLGVITSDAFAWGAQLVQGSVPGDYRATTSAALPCLYADYNGALRARKLCENNAATIAHFMDSSSSTIAAGVFTGVARIKAGERTSATMYLVDSVGIVSGTVSTYNLTTGVVTSGTQASIVSVGGGYFQCAVYGTCAAGAGAKVRVLLSDGSAYTGDGSSGIYIADAQLNDGSSALAYYETTASAYNAPRFDYDPVTLAAKGLLVEESRANLLLNSVLAGTGAAPTSFTQPVATGTSAPATSTRSGISAAYSQSATAQRPFFEQSVTTVATTVYTLSMNIESVSGLVYNDIIGVATLSVSAFRLNGTTVLGTDVAAVGKLEAVVTASGVSSLCRYGIGVAGNATGTLRFSCPQVEAGAFATSFIPTTASQVTRAADVASVNTLSPWYNSVAGTLYVEALANAASPSNQYLATINDGTTNNRVTLFKSTGGAANSRFTVGGVANNPTSLGSSIAGIISKTAITYSTAASGVNIYSNGTAGTAVTSATTPTGMLRLGLGIDETGSTSLINGHLRRVTYYPRQMTSAEGVALTTL